MHALLSLSSILERRFRFQGLPKSAIFWQISVFYKTELAEYIEFQTNLN